MRHQTILIIIAIIAVLAMGIAPQALVAEQQEKYTDFRGRTYTTEELGKALFPEPEMRTRGITAQPQTPKPVKAAVALNVFYAFNSATILDDYYADLDKLGSLLNAPQYRAYRIQIEGYTDSVGSDHYNQGLSERRAASVKRYLVQRFNIDPQRLVVKGYGESRPRASNDTDEGRRQNRRVEVVNIGQ